MFPSVGLPQRQRRPVTYGKKGSRTTSYNLLREDTTTSVLPSRKVSPPATHVESKKPTAGRLVRPSPKRNTSSTLSVFDVPSSDDEIEEALSRSPPHTSKRQVSAEKVKKDESKRDKSLSPQNILSDSSATSRKRKRPTPSPQPAAKPERVQAQEDKKNVRSVARVTQSAQKASIITTTDRPAKSKQAEPKTQSRAIERKITNVVLPVSRTERSTRAGSRSRPALMKGVSAPAILSDMVQDSSEAAFDNYELTPIPSDRPSTPTKFDTDDLTTPSTPPTVRATTGSHGTGSATPRQNQLWNRLFDDSSSSGGNSSPGSLPVNRLDISGRRGETTTRPPALPRSQSDVPRSTQTRRKRLIDSLKQSAPIDELDEEDDEDDSESSDVADEEPTEVFQPTKSNKDESQGSQSQPIAASRANGPKLTYASQRSYLVSKNPEDELDMMLDIPLDIPPPPPLQRQKSSTSQSQKKTGPFAFPDPEEMEDDSQGAVRSVRELRLAGMASGVSLEIQNWLDDIEGNNGSSMAGKRSAMMEFCTKLAIEDDVVGKLAESGLEQAFIRSWAKTSDTILRFSIAVAMILMTGNKRISTDICQRMAHAAIIPILSPLFVLEADINRIAKERKTNMSKVAQKSLLEFRNVIVQKIWPDERPQTVSPRAVALKSAEALTRRLRSDRCTDELMTDDLISTLLHVVAAPMDALSAGLPTNTINMELALSILEAGAISTSSAQALTWSLNSFRQLADMLGTLLSITGEAGSRIQILALKLTVNLTNNNPEACDMFATPVIVHRLVDSIDSHFKTITTELTEDERDMVRDRLVLSLGAMFNLAESSDKARLALVSDGHSSVEALVKCFTEGLERADQADSVEASSTSVAYGYLAILLGNVCLNSQVREAVCTKLPDSNLNVLIQAMERFILFHQKVDIDEGDEVYANFTSRLRAVVVRLRQAAQ